MIKVIFNPESGGSTWRSLERRIIRKFSGLSFDLERTSGPGHAIELARSASRNGARAVVAIGGDGIVNEVVNGIGGSGSILGIIPAGTANDLSRHLGIRRDPAVSCALIRSGFTTVIDTIDVNGRLFLTAGTVGLASEVVRMADRLRSGRIGKYVSRYFCKNKIYVLAGLLALAVGRYRTQSIDFKIDGRTRAANPLWLTVSNQPKMGRYFLVSPDARNDDGYFNVCMAQDTGSRLKTLRSVIGILFGRHESLPDITAFKAKEMTLRSLKPMSFFGDGELLCESRELRIRIRPSSVRVLVPESRKADIRHPPGTWDFSSSP